MARIVNSNRELVDTHTTEEIIEYVVRILSEARTLTAIDVNTGEVTKDKLMVAVTKANVAYDTLSALAEKMKILDDTPTIVA